jgi:O-antigen ligase
MEVSELNAVQGSLPEASKAAFTVKILAGPARFFAILSAACLPLSNAFALGQFVSISILSALLATLMGTLSGEKIKSHVALVCGFFPFALILIGYGSFTLDNWGAHASGIEITKSFRAHFFLLIFACCLSAIHGIVNFDTILKWVSIGVIFSATFGLVDFVLQNFVNISLDSYVYRYTVSENTGSLGAIWRIRSTLTEPGHFAFFLAILAPWVFIYIRNRSIVFRRSVLVILASSFILTFSATGYAIFLLLTFMLAIRERNIKLLFPLFFLLATVGISIFFELSVFTDYIDIFFGKYSGGLGNGTDVSAADRSMRVEAALGFINDAWRNEDLISIFFGHGPGWVITNFGTGFVNVYLYLLVEFGVLGFLSFALFLIFVWWRYVRGQNSLIFYSYFSMVLTFIFIQNYYEIMVIFVISMLVAKPGEV